MVVRPCDCFRLETLLVGSLTEVTEWLSTS